MSKLAVGVLGVIAASLTLGAVQFALGRDLSGGAQLSLRLQASEVNRLAKADRVVAVAASGVPTRTISLRLNGITDRSVLIRIPVDQAVRNGGIAPSVSTSTSGNGATSVACEPVVSILTEVAKRLPPGRCLS